MSSASTPSPGDRPESPDLNLPGSGSLEGDLWSLDDEPQVSMPAALRGAIGDEMPPIKPSRAPSIMTSFADSGPQVEAGPEGEQEIANQPSVTAFKKPDNRGIRLNISPQREAARPSGDGLPIRKSPHLRDFTDLEQWADDGGGQVVAGDALEALESASTLVSVSGSAAAAETEVHEETVVGNLVEALPEESLKGDAKASEVPSNVATPPAQVALPSALKFSSLEKFAVLMLVTALLGVLAAVLYFSASRLPTETIGSRGPKFPVQGQRVTVQTASSYWRDVISTGADPDVVRRGTKLLPVLELGCKGGPAVLRVIFRDEYGISMGDTINRTVTDGGLMVIAATVGFEEIGMHAAYRTGDSKPWTIEVYEGDVGNESANGFRKLFEMDISTERR